MCLRVGGRVGPGLLGSPATRHGNPGVAQAPPPGGDADPAGF